MNSAQGNSPQSNNYGWHVCNSVGEGTCFSTSTFQIFPGFNKALLDTFKIKVTVMADQLKLCCVIFDELAIKENVSYNPEDEV